MTTHQSTSSYVSTSEVSPSDWYQSVYPGDVPSTVRRLLFSTKRLQEVLRHWSKEQASEGDVSDVYVQIGHEFNAVIAAFAFHSIDLSDLHSVPAELRVVLERCLSEDPAPEVLDNSLPDLRKILYKLLKGLQVRREPWRVAAIRLANRSSSSTIETTSV